MGFAASQRGDYIEAVKFFRLAAENQDNDFAQFSLGNAYAYGNGVPRDYVLAYMWYSLAHAKKPDAPMYGNFFDMVAAKMTPDQIAEAQRMAREWNPKTEQ